MLEREATHYFWAELEKGLGLKVDIAKLNHAVLKLKSTELLEMSQKLKNEWGFFFLLDITAIDYLDQGRTPRFDLCYEILNMEHFLRLRLLIQIDETEEIESLTPLWPSCAWYEKEIVESYQLCFQNIQTDQTRSIMRKDSLPVPLETSDVGTHRMESSVLATHENLEVEDYGINLAQTHGPFRLQWQVRNELIEKVWFDHGYSHLGLEKIAESKSYAAILPLLERVNPASSHLMTLTWCRLIEGAREIDIPERAQALRMIFAEFSRIMDHLLYIYLMTKNSVLSDLATQALREKERIHQLFFHYSGKRAYTGLNTFGGVSLDLPTGWNVACESTLMAIQSFIEEFSLRTTRARQWMNRMRTSSLNASTALDWGITGPTLRACGVNYDLRKVAPFYFYRDVDFDIPLGINGDCYDRTLVRSEEVLQSCRIIGQLMDNLPAGEYLHPQFRIEKNKKHPQFFIQLAHHKMEGAWMPDGFFESSLEASNGHLSMTVFADKTTRPQRVRLRTPAFALAQAYPQMIQQRTPEEALTTLCSLNLCSAEVDR